MEEYNIQNGNKKFEDKSHELLNTNIELVEATTQLVQSEKLSVLGKLSASMAHELNQPLNVIKIICQPILRNMEKNENIVLIIRGERA